MVSTEKGSANLLTSTSVHELLLKSALLVLAGDHMQQHQVSAFQSLQTYRMGTLGEQRRGSCLANLAAC